MTQSNQKNGIEILCIGTELLLGNIINSNAKWLAEELSSLGLAHYRQTVVGDNSSRLNNAIIESSNRCRILITTGGLGPTPDDLTTETIAKAFNVQLEQNQAVWKNIKEKLNFNSSTVSKNNEKQSFFPRNSKIIPNQSGTAPGMIWSPKEGFTILTFPGVPSEMKDMWNQTAKPWLIKNGGLTSSFVSKVLHFSDIKESVLAENIGDLLESNNPTVAPYASLGEVRLRITAKARNIDEAKALIRPIEDEIRLREGNKCYGSDEDKLTSVVLRLLRERGETLCVAESCTGGGLGASLTEVSGSSEVFIGGVIAYNNSIKEKILGVPTHLLKEFGAVSLPVVESMAKGVKKLTGADWSIAISGLAGPNGGTKEKPIGLVDFCIAGPGIIQSNEKIFSSDTKRIAIQKLSILRALNELRLCLLEQR